MTAHVELPTLPSSGMQYNEETVNKNLRLVGNSSYDAIVARNLFHPSRSAPGNSPEIVRPVAESELPQLFGTIILDSKKLAILEDRSTKKSDLYRVNGSISGFLIAKILENKVVLQKGGQTVEVNLRDDKEFKRPVRAQTGRAALKKETDQRRRRGNVRRSRTRRTLPLQAKRQR